MCMIHDAEDKSAISLSLFTIQTQTQSSLYMSYGSKMSLYTNYNIYTQEKHV